MGKTIITTAILLLLPTLAASQASVPLAVSSQGTALRTGAEPAQENELFGGISLSSAYDDNAFNSPTHHVGDVQVFVRPQFGIQETRKSVNWSLMYAPGFAYSQHLAAQNYLSHELAGGIQWIPSPRLTLDVREDYLKSSDPFQMLGASTFLPPLNPGQGVNSSVVLPQVTRSAEQTNLDVTYLLTAATSVGVTGSFAASSYGQIAQVPAQSTLIDSYMTTASAFLAHRLSDRQQIGVQYRFTVMTFAPVPARTVAHAIGLFDDITISARSKLSLFAGPERSLVQNQVVLVILGIPIQIPIESVSWGPTVSATYSWSGTRTAVSAGLAHRVNDGGGLMAAVSSTTAQAHLRRNLTRRLSATASASYGDQSELGLNTGTSLRNVWGTATIEYELERNLFVRAGYSRVHQTNGVGVGAFTGGNHNRVEIGLDYKFVKGLGR